MDSKYYMLRASWNHKWILNESVKIGMFGLFVGKFDIKSNSLGSKTKAGLLYNTTQVFLQGGERVYDKME